MSEKRAQGRPMRGGAEVGRYKIVEGLRNLLRSGRSLEVSRKVLAEYTGVTPALISYYFPNKELLMREAVEPVISDYADRLESLIASNGSAELKVKGLIGVFVEMYRKDAHLFEIYQRLGEQQNLAGVLDEMNRMRSSLARFLSEWRGYEQTKSLHAAIFQGAIWGMCNFVNRTEAEALDAESETQDMLFRILTSGFYGSLVTPVMAGGVFAPLPAEVYNG